MGNLDSVISRKPCTKATQSLEIKRNGLGADGTKKGGGTPIMIEINQ